MVDTIIADVLGLTTPPSPDTTLCELGADSLDRQSIAADLDVAFGIEIPDDHVAEWLTVADVAATVARLTQQTEVV